MRLEPLILLAACLLPVSGGALSQPEGSVEPSYLVSMTMRDGARLVATPILTVRANHMAEVAIGEQDGSRYAMRFTVAPQSDRIVSLQSSIDVARASGVRRSAQPALLVRVGERADIEFGEDSATEQPFRVSFQVQPVETPNRAASPL